MKSIRIAALLFFLLGIGGNMAFASVCYLGSAGTPAEKAVMQFFDTAENAVPAANLTEALSMLKSGKCSYAVVPLESVASGLAFESVDAVLANPALAVAGEIKLADNTANLTRFWVISPVEKAPRSGDKAAATVRGSANSVIKLAYELVQMGYKVQAIHDRPIKDRPGEYQFVIEVDGLNPNYALQRLIARPDFKLQGEILGSFDVK
jgi:prephenate dehydratase